jgi:hypothetical protein
MAERIGMRQQWISEHMKVQDAIDRGNTARLKEKNFSTAFGIVERDSARSGDTIGEDVESALFIPGERDDERPISDCQSRFREWAPAYTGRKFNFIHCDSPTSSNTEKRQQGNAPAILGGYDDDEATYWRLLDVHCKNIQRICADSCHIMLWYSMKRHTETLKFFAENSDFVIAPFPLICHKSDNSGLLPDPSRGPRRVYETALFGFAVRPEDRACDVKLDGCGARSIHTPVSKTGRCPEALL